MTRGRLIEMARNLALALAVGLSSVGAASVASAQSIPFGVYDPFADFSDDTSVQIEHLFLPWEDVLLASLENADVYAMERGRALLVTIEPWTWSRDQRDTPEYLATAIKKGEYDGNIRAIGQVLGSLQSSTTVRWAQEMDDYSGQFIWAGWQSNDYIDAYKHVVDILREEAPNLSFMWSPLGHDNLAGYYPGDDYVDVIGLSVFGHQSWEKAVLGAEQSFEDILGPRYERATQFDKPIVVAELGFVGDDEYVDRWMRDVQTDNPRFPRLSGVIYFNQREVYPWPNGFGLPDWRIRSLKSAS